MKQNHTPKFKVGNIIKYQGDTYQIMGINNWGYDVFAIDFTDDEETKTGISFSQEPVMEFISETFTKKEKKFYPVFRVDVCFCGYSIDYVLIGAENIKDLIVHIHDIFNDNDINFGLGSVDDLASETSRFEQVKNLYTDNPYTILDEFSYYE